MAATSSADELPRMPTFTPTWRVSPRPPQSSRSDSISVSLVEFRARDSSVTASSSQGISSDSSRRGTTSGALASSRLSLSLPTSVCPPQRPPTVAPFHRTTGSPRPAEEVAPPTTVSTPMGSPVSSDIDPTAAVTVKDSDKDFTLGRASPVATPEVESSSRSLSPTVALPLVMESTGTEVLRRARERLARARSHSQHNKS